MDLVKENWNKDAIKELEEYLFSISHLDKVPFENKIVNTSQTMLGISMPTLRVIAKEIYKGNYLSYIKNNPRNYYEENILEALVISLIKDENLQFELLDNYLPTCDSWAHTDSIKSKYIFKRRCGILVFFKLIETDYLKDIFELINGMSDEQEYYVNMAIAWFLCDAFIKRREETLGFLSTTSLQKFTVNKAISKCRDSFRVSKEDKELLLKYKK